MPRWATVGLTASRHVVEREHELVVDHGSRTVADELLEFLASLGVQGEVFSRGGSLRLSARSGRRPTGPGAASPGSGCTVLAHL